MIEKVTVGEKNWDEVLQTPGVKGVRKDGDSFVVEAVDENGTPMSFRQGDTIELVDGRIRSCDLRKRSLGGRYFYITSRIAVAVAADSGRKVDNARWAAMNYFTDPWMAERCKDAFSKFLSQSSAKEADK